VTDAVGRSVAAVAVELGPKRLARRIGRHLDAAQGFTELCNALRTDLEREELIGPATGTFDRRRLAAWVRQADVRSALSKPEADELLELREGLADCWRTDSYRPSPPTPAAIHRAATVLHRLVLVLALPEPERAVLFREREQTAQLREIRELATRVSELQEHVEGISGDGHLGSWRSSVEPPIVRPGEFAGPSEYIMSRSGVVPFSARHSHLSRLLSWADGPQDFSSIIVSGIGGAGKTRIAVELCKELNDEGWLCGFINNRLPPATPRTHTGEGLMLVVDYADGRVTQLAELVTLLASTPDSGKVRLLLLVRTSEQDPHAIRARFGTQGALLKSVADSAQVLALDAIPLDIHERRDLFNAASDAFATDLVTPRESGSTNLTDDTFASPLAVTIEAYLASTGDSQLAPSLDGLLERLVAHEDRHWQHLGEDLGLDSKSRRILAALTTVADPDDLSSASVFIRAIDRFSTVSSERIYRLVEYVAQVSTNGERLWNPPQPDRLAEHLFSTTIANELTLLRKCLDGSHERSAHRTIGLFCSLADCYPVSRASLAQIASEQFLDLITLAASESEEGSAVDGNPHELASLLSTCFEELDITNDQARAALSLLSAKNRFLLRLRIEAQRHLVDAGKRTDELTVEHAEHLEGLTVDLFEAGFLVEALSPAREAEAMYRLLGADSSTEGLGKMSHSQSLRHLGALNAQSGSLELGLTQLREALALVESSFDVADPSHWIHLALTKSNLAGPLASAGHLAEAIASIDDALVAFDKGGRVDGSGVAGCLINKSKMLAASERPTEALEDAETAVRMLRSLDDAEPYTVTPLLAASLHNLSFVLQSNGSHSDAEEAQRECVQIYRRLIVENRAAYSPSLAMALYNQGLAQQALGRPEDALRSLLESESLYQRLASFSSGDYLALYREVGVCCTFR